MIETLLVYNPNHQGGRAVSSLGGNRALRWDRPVRSVPRSDARDLIRLGGCHECVTVTGAAKRFSLDEDAVVKLAEDGVVQVAEHTLDKGKSQTVIVLDPQTSAILVTTARETAKAAKDKPRKKKSKEE